MFKSQFINVMFYDKEIKMSYFYYRLFDTCKKTKV